MLGQQLYARAELDHYPTPPEATKAFLKTGVAQALLANAFVWEPACGDGAIVKVIESCAKSVFGSDIAVYPGDYEPNALVDFLKIVSLDEVFYHHPQGQPTGIVTNPPYGKEAEAFARQALKLMAESGGFVVMLCRHEWDTAKSRKDLFDHPAFLAKVTLRFRPRWIKNTKGSPRHSYAWYVWSWSKDRIHAPNIFYAG
ncbi:putative DNA methylase protein [Caulobacter phage C1]|nr:putative DNA methylase protein [Caulobacter phage C1]UTU08402.1 putative DNA methylase protein [Caulobacter phage C2]UTU08919.1 putative DNA methylase protein [Caulobacter phage J4]UTU09475.1 putative DNA methylase protein [Caulobacter phage BL47]UTU10035.1 putative DNA methylase protein [Caulobacter phage RB23]WGN97070.1 putative DNA methylase protein [Bertelyvirus sp.]